MLKTQICVTRPQCVKAVFRTACPLEAMNAYFDAIEDDFLNWTSEVLMAVGTDVIALRVRTHL